MTWADVDRLAYNEQFESFGGEPHDIGDRLDYWIENECDLEEKRFELGGDVVNGCERARSLRREIEALQEELSDVLEGVGEDERLINMIDNYLDDLSRGE